MKDKITRIFKSILSYLEYNKKTILINVFIFLIVFAILILIDQLTKSLLFKWDDSTSGINQIQGYQYKNWLFGIRSVFNTGLTANFLNSIPLAVVHLFNFVILIACITFLIVLRSKWFAIFIGFIFSGVRDIVFLPWADKGTFNFADVDAIFGTLGSLITLIVLLFRNDQSSKIMNKK